MSTDLSRDPAVIALAPVRNTVKMFATNLVIKSADGYTEAGERLKIIKKALSDIEEARTRITRPMNESLRETNAQAKAAAAPFLTDESTIKQAMLAYAREQDRLRIAEQRRLNKIADDERKRLQEIADRASAKGQEGKAEQFQERAAQVVAPIAEATAPKVAGISIPKVWTWELVDAALIPREFLTVNEVMIGKVVRALKGETRIPGVRVFEQDQIRAGKA